MTQTIGQKLKQTRESKRLTLEKVFEATRIRVPYLQALEMDDPSILPSPVQARGYLRNYANFLGLDFEQMLEEMRAEKKPSDEIIGPVDSIDGLATQTTEPISVQPAAPLPTPESGSVSLRDSQPEPASIQEETPLPKPKPTRRKKADAQPESESTAPKRRGREKAESQPEPVIELQPEVLTQEHLIVAEPEPVVEEPIELHPEETTKPDVGESLWQTWLNRVSTVISSRRTPKEEPQTEQDIQQNEPAEPENLQPETVPTDTQLPESTRIFIEVGTELRKRRELLSLHLDEVERNTHVKAHYLEALEKGAMDDLPSTVQTRGMLSNYATFLDLEVDALLLRFADGLQARHREKNPQKPARKPGQPIIANMPNLTNFIAGDMIFGVGVAILLVGFSIWAISRVLTIQSEQEVDPTAPSISDVLLASPDPSSFTVTPTFQTIESLPGEATVTIVIPTLNTNVNVQVNLVAVERTYMRVTVDGKVKFDGRVTPGNAYPFEAEEQIEVLVGSGAAIRLVYNGRDLGLLGAFGQVVSNIYLADEIITPTALPTTAPTNTFTPTATLTPTRTPVPSNTPAP